MTALRPPLRMYVLAVSVAGPLVLALLALRSSIDLAGLAVAVLLFALATVSQRWPVHLTPKMKLTVEDTATFAAALLLDPALAMTVAGGSTLAGLRFGHRMTHIERTFNAATTALGTGASASVYLALALPGGIVANPLAVVAAAATKYLVEATLVDLAVALQLRRDPLSAWWAVHRRDLPHVVALYLLGALAALVAGEHPWALSLFAVPVGIVLLTVRESARLRERTREAVLHLADLIDLRDPYTHGHSQRVAALAERTARRMGLSHAQVELVREAARVHDIGKIGTDDGVLLKPGPLDERERAEMQRHSELGAKFLRQLPEFWEGAALVLAHHERVDGTGYPRHLTGAELPLEAAIIAVTDAYDAMATDRPYRQALSWAAIRGELLRGRGTQWSPEAVDAFIALLEEPAGRPAAVAVGTAS